MYFFFCVNFLVVEIAAQDFVQFNNEIAFKFIKNQNGEIKSQDIATQECQKLGGNMTIIKNQSQLDFIMLKVIKRGMHLISCGLYNSYLENMFFEKREG